MRYIETNEYLQVFFGVVLNEVRDLNVLRSVQWVLKPSRSHNIMLDIQNTIVFVLLKTVLFAHKHDEQVIPIFD
jgi:hypothetical protein